MACVLPLTPRWPFKVQKCVYGHNMSSISIPWWVSYAWALVGKGPGFPWLALRERCLLGTPKKRRQGFKKNAGPQKKLCSGWSVKGRITASRASASAQSSSEADCHWEVTATTLGSSTSRGSDRGNQCVLAMRTDRSSQTNSF